MSVRVHETTFKLNSWFRSSKYLFPALQSTKNIVEILTILFGRENPRIHCSHEPIVLMINYQSEQYDVIKLNLIWSAKLVHSLQHLYIPESFGKKKTKSWCSIVNNLSRKIHHVSKPYFESFSISCDLTLLKSNYHIYFLSFVQLSHSESIFTMEL